MQFLPVALCHIFQLLSIYGVLWFFKVTVDYNTFDFVIQVLIDVCEHDSMQAENCAMIAHYKGKCQIMNGTNRELVPYYTELTNRKLTVEIK